MERKPPERAAQARQGAEKAELDSKFIIRHNGPVGTTAQQIAAAAFFKRTRKESPIHHPFWQTKINEANEKTKQTRIYDFSTVLGKCPPPVSPSILRKVEADEDLGIGKVRVILRVANSEVTEEMKESSFKLDKRKRQVTLSGPDLEYGCPVEGLGSPVPSSPKMFTFDGIFTNEDPQFELCALALEDPIHAVVQGTDATLFSFGHSGLGKTYTMIGSDESNRTLGIIPTAIAWLYKAINEKKERTMSRCSVRVSAIEIGSRKEEVRDLLSNIQLDDQNSESKCSQPASSISQTTFFSNRNELRCQSAEKAGELLDAALMARSANNIHFKDSHFVFTLHLYQYSVEASRMIPQAVKGGKSCLHLIDFGNCDRIKSPGGTITLSGLGNVILSILNGQRHLANKECKVTQLLKECLGPLSSQTSMLAHVSPEPSRYSETLHTIQVASRVHRMRKKKPFRGTYCGSRGLGLTDESRHRLVRPTSSSDFTTSTDPSSCDTVIYLGSRDDDGTDSEHPPEKIPNLNSEDQRGHMAKALYGSTAEMPNVLFPSYMDVSPMLGAFLGSPIPSGSLRQRPGSVESTPTHESRHPKLGGSLPRNSKAKMPLTGKVGSYRQASSSPINQRNILHQQCHSSPWSSHYKTELQNCQGISGSAESVIGFRSTKGDNKMKIQRGTEVQQTGQLQIMGFNYSHPPSMSSLNFKKHQIMEPEPEPYAWLNDVGYNWDSGCGEICLTQFKTAESNDQQSMDDFQETIPVRWDEDHPCQCQGCNSKDKNLRGTSFHFPRQESIPVLEDPQTFEEIFSNCEKLVQKLNFEESERHEEVEPSNFSLHSGQKDLSGACFRPQTVAGWCLQNEEISNRSSDESLESIVKALDMNSLHYVKEKKNIFHSRVAEADDSLKIAKLHELYQSVSTIKAKFQSHLEANKHETPNLNKLSSFSLSALANKDNQSVKSEESLCEISSLCSEPAKMFGCEDPRTNREDKSNTSTLRGIFDEYNLGMSLGDLEDIDQFTPRENENELNRDRSCSPMKVGDDIEFAKYAKLKGLKNTYHHPWGPFEPQAIRRVPDQKLINQPGSKCLGAALDPSIGVPKQLLPVVPPSCSSSLSSGNGNGTKLLQNINKDRKHIAASEWNNPSLLRIDSNNTTLELNQDTPLVSDSNKKGLKLSRFFKLSRSHLKDTKEKRGLNSDDDQLKVENNNEKSSQINAWKGSPGRPRKFGSDPGHESGAEKTSKWHKFGSSFMKQCTFVKLRSQGGRGAALKPMPSPTSKHTCGKKNIQVMADMRASHCKSSGYESGGGPGFDSVEKGSIRSFTGVTLAPLSKVPPDKLLNYIL